MNKDKIRKYSSKCGSCNFKDLKMVLQESYKIAQRINRIAEIRNIKVTYLEKIIINSSQFAKVKWLQGSYSWMMMMNKCKMNKMNKLFQFL